jgi:methylmalonyl-CoA epimerase
VITRVSFVGIAVNDIEEAQRLYTEVLGLKPWDQGVVEMPGVKVVMFPLGDCYLELLQPTVGPEDPVGGNLARWMEKRGEGLCRLGLWVDNIEAEVKRLRESGVRVIESGEYGRIGEEMGAKMAFIHPKSTLGVLIELDQQI